jgi:hypothetical protein
MDLVVGRLIDSGARKEGPPVIVAHRRSPFYGLLFGS